MAWREKECVLPPVPPTELLPACEVGRPAYPELVPPRLLPKRGLGTLEGRAALVHALAHIEFNAINLAWDAVYRFRGMPTDYYTDWIQVALEESLHFSLLQNHLQKLGFAYGSFPAHNGLWEMALETAYDPLVRMALVPRVLEARGLDVTPGIMEKFASVGDNDAVNILKIILRDEIGHVATGSRWFFYLCQERNLNATETFRDLLRKHLKSGLKLPFSMDARLQAGFTPDELSGLVANI